MSDFFFFTDIATLDTQSNANAYGPDATDNTKFNVTSVHTKLAGATTTPKAYAVCDGILLVQPITGSSTLVNLILKPTSQPPFAFPKVKFFIYRGVDASSIINGANIAVATKSDLTKSIWDSQGALDTANNATGTTSPPNGAVGIDITANGSIDDVFYSTGNTYQLPVVKAGWSLGEFDESSSFGFEIMLESIGFDPALPLVRTAKNTITVSALGGTPTQAAEFEYWHDKEAILNYIDPAAFYGNFYGFGLKYYAGGVLSIIKKSKVVTEKDKIYNEILKGAHLSNATDFVFYNNNKIYLDIRNEYNHSLNYFKNYGDTSSFATAEIKIQNTSTGLTLKNYYDSNWPLLILSNADFPTSTGSSLNIKLSLPDRATGAANSENPCPTIYVSCGYFKDTFPSEPKDKAKLKDLTYTSFVANAKNYTDTIELATPNKSGGAGTIAISAYIKLKYFKRFDPSAATPPVSSGTVIRASHYLDNVICPKNIKIPYPTSAGIRSVVFEDEFFIDNKVEENNDAVCSIGMSEDSNNVTMYFYPAVKRNYSQEIKQSRLTLPSIKTDISEDFVKQLEIQYSNLLLEKGVLKLNSGNVDVLVLNNITSSNNEKFDDIKPDDFYSFIVTKAEFTSIINLINDTTKFSQKFSVYLGIANIVNATDNGGNAYTNIDLVLNGFKLIDQSLATERYTNNQVSTSFKIYTNA